MADQASINTFVASWFTPSSFFLFLNLFIGTIAFTFHFSTSRKPPDQPHHDAQPHLVYSSSLLECFRSFHFYKYDVTFPETEYLQPLQDSPQLVRMSSLIKQVKSFNFGFYNNSEPTVADTESVRPDDPPEDTTELQLARTPSLLERLKSMNFSLYRSDFIKAAGEGEAEVHVQETRPDHDSKNLVRRSKS